MTKEQAINILDKLKDFKNNNDTGGVAKLLLKHKKYLDEYVKHDPILKKRYKLLCLRIEKKFIPKREYI